jgi:hypothetical protein
MNCYHLGMPLSRYELNSLDLLLFQLPFMYSTTNTNSATYQLSILPFINYNKTLLPIYRNCPYTGPYRIGSISFIITYTINTHIDHIKLVGGSSHQDLLIIQNDPNTRHPCIHSITTLKTQLLTNVV